MEPNTTALTPPPVVEELKGEAKELVGEIDHDEKLKREGRRQRNRARRDARTAR